MVSPMVLSNGTGLMIMVSLQVVQSEGLVAKWGWSFCTELASNNKPFMLLIGIELSLQITDETFNLHLLREVYRDV